MALSYSKTHSTSMARRLDCTRDGDFRSMTWYREGSGESGGFTTNGDSSEANRFNTVTVTTPCVTVTGWSSKGSTKYRVYCTLHTPFGNYQTATTTLTWDDNTTSRTFTFTFNNVLGEWTHFSVWANQDTYTVTSGPYMYWFNNNGGTITVTYTEATGSGGTTLPDIGADGEGKWVAGKYYVWKTTNPTTYYYPEAAMTSNNSQGCVVSASSVRSSSYQIYSAFNKKSETESWITVDSNTDQHWIQIMMPRALYNITVQIRNRGNSNYINGMTAGNIYGVDKDGTTLTHLYTISGRDGSTKNALSVHNLNNSTKAYWGIRVESTAVSHYGNDKYLAINEILVIGTDIGSSNGAWVEANPLVWKTENAKTYTYPAAAMTSYTSQNCIVCASSSSNNNFQAWRAFDKNVANNWASHTSTYDPQPWIQITIPRPLYNIKVQINNDSGTAKGPVDGIIYGSNDFGTTLTQIGSFSGRSSAASVSTITQCNNTTIAYNTIRILITTLPSGQTNVDIGEIYVSGTDIGTNGGWANLKEKTLNPIVIYPKVAMTSDISQDCILASSSILNSNYANVYAFNKNWTDNGWISKETSEIHWLSIVFPEPLYNINIALVNRGGTSGGTLGFSIGDFYGTTDGGATWEKIISFSGRDKDTRSTYTSHSFRNKTIAYNGVKLVSGNTGTKAVAELEIYGTKRP